MFNIGKKIKDNIPKKYLNSSARNIKNKRKISFLKRYIKNFDDLNIKDNLSAAIIIPDKDIIPGAETLSPAYIIFDNYEKIYFFASCYGLLGWKQPSRAKSQP